MKITLKKCMCSLLACYHALLWRNYLYLLCNDFLCTRRLWLEKYTHMVFSSPCWMNLISSIFFHLSHSPVLYQSCGSPLDPFNFFIFFLTWTLETAHYSTCGLKSNKQSRITIFLYLLYPQMNSRVWFVFFAALGHC